MKSWRILSCRGTVIFRRAPSRDSASCCGRISWNSIASHEEIEHRHYRTRLHGPRAFERLRPGQPFLPNREYVSENCFRGELVLRNTTLLFLARHDSVTNLRLLLRMKVGAAVSAF